MMSSCEVENPVSASASHIVTDSVTVLLNGLQEITGLAQRLASLDASVTQAGVLDGTLCTKFEGSSTSRMYVRRPSGSPDKEFTCTYIPNDPASRAAAIAAHDRGQLQREIRRAKARHDKQLNGFRINFEVLFNQLMSLKAQLVDDVEDATARYRSIEFKRDKTLSATDQFRVLDPNYSLARRNRIEVADER